MSGHSLRNLLSATHVYSASVSNIFFIVIQKFNLVFRQAHNTDPSHQISDFSLTTSTSGLQKHPFMYHVEEWVTSCDSLKISITAGVKLGDRMENVRSKVG